MATEPMTNVASPGAAQASATPTPPATPAAPEVTTPTATPPPPAGSAVTAAGEASPAETPPLEGEKAPEADKRELEFQSRFGALAKRERSIVEKEKALKAQAQEIETLKKAREEAATNPLALLEAHGWNYDDLTNFVINGRKLTPEQEAAYLRKKLDEKSQAEKAAEEAASKAQLDEANEVITTFKTSLKEFIDQGGDDFELIRNAEAYDTVYEVIEQHFNEHGQVLPMAEAAKHVEAYLEKEAEKRILGAKKFQRRLAPSEPPKAEAGQETPRPAPTLTNRSVASAPTQTTDTRHLSEEESKRRAAAMLRWTD